MCQHCCFQYQCFCVNHFVINNFCLCACDVQCLFLGEFHLLLLFFSRYLIVAHRRCVTLFRQHIRYYWQHHLHGMQSRHILSGRHGDAIALPRRVLLPGCRRGLGCAAPRVSCGVVLQCIRGHFVSDGSILSHTRTVCERTGCMGKVQSIGRHDDLDGVPTLSDRAVGVA
jgi:hypothetical protein